MYQFGYCEKINTNLEVAAVFVTFCMNPAFTAMTANLVIAYRHEHVQLQMMRQTYNTQTYTDCLTHLPPHLCCELFKQIPQYFFDLKICRCNKQCQEKGLHVLGQVMPTYEHNNHKVVKLVCQKHTTAQSLQASCSITYTILFESLSGKQFPQLSHCSALLYRCVKDLTNISLLRQHMI